jgi:hypothetical protein
MTDQRARDIRSGARDESWRLSRREAILAITTNSAPLLVT